jgi:23S rRNA (guanosine2251-2'-O)-methyltransferase
MKLVAVLDNVRSLHNVGSIFRTSDGAGVAQLYLCGITPEPLDRFGRIRPPFAKVALGAEQNVPWEKVSRTVDAIKKLKRAGYRIIALEQTKNSIPYNSLKIGKNAKVALIVGEEVEGLTPRVLGLCDEVIEIRMRGTKESLNVSVAFGIAAFELASNN